MAAVDIVLLLVLLASVLLGLWRGLVFEVLSVAGWVLAFFLAQWHAERAASWLPLADTAPPLRYAAGFALVFVGTLFASSLLAWLTKKAFESVGLRPIDRVLGAGFGLLRGMILLLALALLVRMTPWVDSEPWQQAAGPDGLEAALQALKGFMPDTLAQYFP
jgi:membrane protein required for colicin V production